MTQIIKPNIDGVKVVLLKQFPDIKSDNKDCDLIKDKKI